MCTSHSQTTALYNLHTSVHAQSWTKLSYPFPLPIPSYAFFKAQRKPSHHQESCLERSTFPWSQIALTADHLLPMTLIWGLSIINHSILALYPPALCSPADTSYSSSLVGSLLARGAWWSVHTGQILGAEQGSLVNSGEQMWSSEANKITSISIQ